MRAYQIGPALATDLMKSRPFKSWDDVAKLTGISEVRLSSLQSKFQLLEEEPEDPSELEPKKKAIHFAREAARSAHVAASHVDAVATAALQARDAAEEVASRAAVFAQASVAAAKAAQAAAEDAGATLEVLERQC